MEHRIGQYRKDSRQRRPSLLGRFMDKFKFLPQALPSDLYQEMKQVGPRFRHVIRGEIVGEEAVVIRADFMDWLARTDTYYISVGLLSPPPSQ